jgi:ABC-2 type transport system ATP-binding protein
MSAIIDVQNLYKQYDPPEGVTAVADVSFTIKEGEIFSLLGPNGAGKTTTISMLSCLLRPSAGDALVDGRSITRQPGAVKKVIGVVPQEIALYESITARENLQFWGKMYGLRGRPLAERVTAVLQIAGLSDRADDKVETYSGGMKRRINIAVALIHQPRILYMDEPTVGIDPQSRRRILDTVKLLNEQGLTVLYTTHYMEEAQELSDRIGIIDHSRLIALGTQKELTEMVGEYDTIRLALVGEGQDGATVAAELAQLPLITQASSENGRLILQTGSANDALPAIVSHLAQSDRHIHRLEIQEPNLEATFLHLTGRALRD